MTNDNEPSMAPPRDVIDAAKALIPDAPYWPGKDYPDRDVWLAKRAAQRAKPQPRVVYTGRQPLALGLNVVKRRADASENPEQGRRNIVKHRHDYYRDRYENKS